MYVKIEDQKSSKQQLQQTFENERNSQMHSLGETGAGVPAFLAKLWRLVDDPETNNLICWSKDGRSFIIQNQAQFARELLPLNYKHNNMASFIRQLNMYGFHKITSIDNGGLKFDRDEMEFSHPYFKRNCSYLLEHIKRKISNTKNTDDKSAVKTEAVTKVLQDVRAMRGRQDSLDSRFSIMKQENEALWREIASLRQKHAKQQQIVNKLIQFLITIVQPSRNMSGVKRHMQLMINDTPETEFRKASESESECGPVIHELGEELLEEVAADNDDDLMDPISPYARSSVTQPDIECPSPLNMERPQSSTSFSSQHYDYSNQSVEDALAGGAVGLINTSNQRMASPNIQTSPTAAGPSNNNNNNNNNGSSVVQSVTPDGVKIVYHVTEVPDAHPNEQDANAAVTSSQKATAAAGSFNEENTLTTPMVREQMARTQMMKQKNKQRRQQSDQAAAAAAGAAAGPLAYKNAARVYQTSPVKVEPDIDPMLFLNTYDDNRRLTPDPRLISPNYSEDSVQSLNANNMTLTSAGGGPASVSPLPIGSKGKGMQLGQQAAGGSSANMYNAGDFITDNIPNELFDDSSILSSGAAGDNSNYSENFKPNEQQEYGLLATLRGGKFAASNNGGKNISASNGNNKNGNADNNAASTSTGALNLPSTSAAANALAVSSNDNIMAVTKYNKNAADGGGGGGVGDVSRDEVHGHLENVQDELETLKELLRSDGYSLDANTLMSLIQLQQLQQNEGMNPNANNAHSNLDADIINKLGLLEGTPNQNNNASYTVDTELLNKLFNDSEVLGPYGLSVYSDLPNNMNQQNEAKGSELMTYQPAYDLSDILDKSDMEDTNSQSSGPLRLTTNIPTPNSSSVLNTPISSSYLNTPYHE